MRANWLPVVLRAAGLEVIELAGWETRGRSLQAIEGVVCHHTATGPNVADSDVARLLRDGRRDLAGPLSQLGLDRQGRYWLITSGKANHNGYGRWGNESIGIEAFNSGTGEPWPQVQLDAYREGVRAILAHLGFGPDRCLGHKETDPSRKIDPAGIDMDAFRRSLAQQKDDLMVKIWNIGGHLYGALYVNGGKTPVQAWHLTQAQADNLVEGKCPQEKQGPEVLKLVEVIGTRP